MKHLNLRGESVEIGEKETDRRKWIFSLRSVKQWKRRFKVGSTK
jgi:hypothetical protein